MKCEYLKLNFTSSSFNAMNDVQVHYKWHGDVDAALRGMPRHLTVERAIVGFLDLFPDIGHVIKINSSTFSS